MKSDIELLLQKALSDEKENDRLCRSRMSLEIKLNEIRGQLHELKECAAFEESLDYLDGKLSLVNSISTEERRKNMYTLVEELRSRVSEAIMKQSSAQGVSDSSAEVGDEDGNNLQRSVSTQEPSTYLRKGSSVSTDDGSSLPCEIEKTMSLDSSTSMSCNLMSFIISEVNSKQSQENEVTPKQPQENEVNSKQPQETTAISYVQSEKEVKPPVVKSSVPRVNVTTRPKRMNLYKHFSKPFDESHQSVLIASSPSASHILASSVSSHDISSSYDPAIPSTQRTTPLVSLQSSHSLHSFSYARSPPSSPSTSATHLQLSSVSHTLQQSSSGQLPTQLPNPPVSSSIPPVQSLEGNSLLDQPVVPPLSSSIRLPTSPIHVHSLDTDTPSHQQELNTLTSPQLQILSNQSNSSGSDKSRSSTLSSLDQNNNKTSHIEANVNIENQDNSLPQQLQSMINGNENQSPLNVTATGKDRDGSHSAGEKKNQVEDVRALLISYVDSQYQHT